MEKQHVLKSITFGERIAEEEVDELSSYFVETDQWRSIFAGNVDIVYGPKGAGKSAIYSLLLNRKQELAEESRRIIVIAAENPRGATVFKELADRKLEITEQELYNLWKLYFLSLVADTLRKEGLLGSQIKKVIGKLEENGLLPRETTLSKLLHPVVDYVRNLFQVESFEVGATPDLTTGMPSFTGKITFREPDAAQQRLGFVSVDELLKLVNTALEQSRLNVWVLLDRLDVAFAESKELEHKALRALFRAYGDLRALDRLSFKIFLRSDIWRLITREGFPGASHIVRSITISWDEEWLLNLVIRRVLNNPTLQGFYNVSQSEILSSTQKQSELFYRIFPLQVDKGSNRPPTFKWILTQTQDGLGQTAPRELIHFLTSAQEFQSKSLAVGGNEPQGEALFDTLALKKALPDVSITRYQQTLLAEFPKSRQWLEKLDGQKTEQTAETLATLWKIDREQALFHARELVEIGFFKERRPKKGESTFWVPFLYRDALKMIQGSAK
jgi:hypothetical protein